MTVGDLIDHFPRRYEDFRDRKQIRDLKVGEEATVRATVVRVTAERTARRRVDVVKVLLRDDTGAIEAVWFNQRYLTKVLAEDMQLSVRGVFRHQGGRASFVVKSHEILDEEDAETVHTEGIVPVYPASEQVSARLLRGLLRAVRPAMRRLPDPLPAELRATRGTAVARRRHPGGASAARPRRGQGRARPPRAGGAAAHAGGPAAAQGRAAAPGRGAGAAAAGRAQQGVPRRAAVRAHRPTSWAPSTSSRAT